MEPRADHQTKEQRRANPDILHRVDAAEFLGLSHHTLARWTCQGRGPLYVKVGRSVRYRRGDLVKFLEEQTVPTSNPMPDHRSRRLR
jgi:predicted DNA-binding transcriptional regulator AlpA